MVEPPSGRRARAIAARLAVTAVAIGLWFLTQFLIRERSVPPSGIADQLHTFTEPLNHYLLLHTAATRALLISSTAIIDLLAIFILAEWVFGTSIRPLVGLAILLGLRQAVQALCALPQPEDMIWYYPGFPSILVTYSVSNDFFFSGHTAVAVFGATELARMGRRWLTILAICLVVFEVVTVLTLRAHYTMDVFTGGITSLYVAHLAEKISPRLDKRLAAYLGAGA